MALAVVLTANHFVIDAVTGGVVALAGLALAFRLADIVSRRSREVGSTTERVDGVTVLPGRGFNRRPRDRDLSTSCGRRSQPNRRWRPGG